MTRPTRDGGRDAVGTYRIGSSSDPVRIDFALEAKCLAPRGGGVNVRMVSRLISRLKHRDFGVFVTTAHIGNQPYREVREDGHPIAFITGRDIVEILRDMGYTRLQDLVQYLRTSYPVRSEDAEVESAALEGEGRISEIEAVTALDRSFDEHDYSPRPEEHTAPRKQMT